MVARAFRLVAGAAFCAAALRPPASMARPRLVPRKLFEGDSNDAPKPLELKDTSQRAGAGPASEPEAAKATRKLDESQTKFIGTYPSQKNSGLEYGLSWWAWLLLAYVANEWVHVLPTPKEVVALIQNSK
ncbi:hypothetical protein M885DRAFT_621682 [Pelagophyceae sp. CCMP2097]|nr:hypothetical protein M885DRAFT_621682 [Pelagophyceae sp. CCMP2097]